MKDLTLSFFQEKIIHPDGGVIMHSWEHPIMQKKAEWICQNGGNILEIGFGMGISADYIQQHNIKSHTICEINTQVLNNLYKWVKDKPNTKIIEGDWYTNIHKMGKYDGILIDTYGDRNFRLFGSFFSKLCNENCHVTWWNHYPNNCETFGYSNTEFEPIKVNPPLNDYFNHKEYLSPKYIYNHAKVERIN
jgi:hypothetical protein